MAKYTKPEKGTSRAGDFSKRVTIPENPDRGKTFPMDPKPWAQKFEDLERDLDEASKNAIMRSPLAVHHLLMAVDALREIVKEHIQDET